MSVGLWISYPRSHTFCLNFLVGSHSRGENYAAMIPDSTLSFSCSFHCRCKGKAQKGKEKEITELRKLGISHPCPRRKKVGERFEREERYMQR